VKCAVHFPINILEDFIVIGTKTGEQLFRGSFNLVLFILNEKYRGKKVSR